MSAGSETPDRAQPYRRPRDAATLILVDRSEGPPRVLLGKRHHGHVFMPGKFVFPGGRAEAMDRHAPFSSPLHAAAEAKLMQRIARPSPAKARALALASIRETYEETGLLLGARMGDGMTVKRRRPNRQTPWQAFADAGIAPDLSAISFVARAVTPPQRNRRYDTRFFAADASTVAHRIDGMVSESTELVELVWVPIADTQHLDLPGITRRVLAELQTRIANGFAHDLPVPFFFSRRGKFNREML